MSFSEDDEEAVKRNLIKLKEECLKPNPSKTDLIPLQRSTFSSRREFILSGLDTANDILEEHPVLHLSFAVSDYIHCIVAYFIQPCTCFFIQVEIEMDLILSQKDTFKKAMANWAKLVPAIIKYSESFSGKIGDGLKKIRDENQGMLHKFCVQIGRYITDQLICSDDLNQSAFLLLVNLFGKKEAKTKQEPLKFAYVKCKVGHLIC